MRDDGLADTKYRPCPLLVKFVEAYRLGKATGEGFMTIRAIRRRPAGNLLVTKLQSFLLEILA